MTDGRAGMRVIDGRSANLNIEPPLAPRHPVYDTELLSCQTNKKPDAESYLAWLIRQCATPSGPQIRAPRRGERQLTITTPNTRVSLANENDGDGPPARSNVSPHAAPGFAPWALP